MVRPWDETEETGLLSTDVFWFGRESTTETLHVTAENLAYNLRGEWTKILSDYYTATPPAKVWDPANPTTDPAAVSDWEASTEYSAGDFVKPATANGFIYECVTGGTSGDTEPTFGTTIGSDTDDNGVSWRCHGVNVVTLTASSSLSTWISPGTPFMYSYPGLAGGYGICVAIDTDNEWLVLAGAPLRTDEALTGLYFGSNDVVKQRSFFISGQYGDGIDSTLYKNDMKRQFRWSEGPAYLVDFTAWHATDAGTTQPYINVTVGGDVVSRGFGGKGLQPLNSGFVRNGHSQNGHHPDICTTNYYVENGDLIEISCTAAGVGSQAEDLTVELVFVHKTP